LGGGGGGGGTTCAEVKTCLSCVPVEKNSALSKSMARPTESSGAGRAAAPEPDDEADADSVLRFGLRPRYTCI
jgi:hypothetical protein